MPRRDGVRRPRRDPRRLRRLARGADRRRPTRRRRPPPSGEPAGRGGPARRAQNIAFTTTDAHRRPADAPFTIDFNNEDAERAAQRRDQGRERRLAVQRRRSSTASPRPHYPVPPLAAGDVPLPLHGPPEHDRHPRRSSRSTTGWRPPPCTPPLPPYRSRLYEWLTTTDHKKIGILYLVNSMIFFFAGGILALVVRLQLAIPRTPRSWAAW